MIPELQLYLLLKMTFFCLRVRIKFMGLPELSPRSKEILSPLKSFQGWWETTIEFIFISSHEQCAQHTSYKQNKSGLSNRDLFFSPKKEFGGRRL